jgi:hypothetical protein
MNAYGINDGDWKLFLDHRGEGCVSIFMPTYRPMGDGRQDQIRLRNLLRDAGEKLGEHGLAQRSAEVLKPAHELTDEAEFWRQPRKGVAVFSAPGFFRAYHLPIDVGERVVVADRFFLRPLMPLYQTRGGFYLLALSLNAVRLFEGRRESLDEIDLAGVVPTSFKDAMGIDEYDTVVQVHSTSTSSLGRPGMVHGHGDNDQEKLKKDVLHYFQAVAKGLGPLLRDKRAPLILAAVQEHFPLYKTANKHPHLLEEGLTGNPDALAPHEIHERAWPVAERFLLRERDEALERFRELRASGRVSSEVEDLVRAAEEGRVDVLLLAEDSEMWGTFDDASAEVELHLDPGNGDEELLDRAAYSTLVRGGTVFTLPAGRLPEGRPAAAVYRY